MALTASLSLVTRHAFHHLSRRWQLRRSRREFYKQLAEVAQPGIPGGERLALLCAALPGESTAILQEQRNSALSIVHLQRREPRADPRGAGSLPTIPGVRLDFANWVQDLKDLHLSSALVRDIPRRASHWRSWLRPLWPWRYPACSAYLIEIPASHGPRLWAAGVCGEAIYLPSRNALEEQVRRCLLPPAPDARPARRVREPEPASADQREAWETPETAGRRAPGDPARRVSRSPNTLPRIVHDMRLPLSRLLSIQQNLKLKLQDSLTSLPSRAAGRELELILARMSRQFRIMERFTYDILHLETGSSLDGGTETFPITEPLDEIFDAHLDLMERKRIVVLRDLPAQPPVCRLNRTAVDRVLFNLIANSVQFCSSPGQIHLKVSTRIRHIVVDLEDSGPGLTSQEYAFELSRQNIGRGGSGWGIGLASARDLSSNLGGRLITAPARHGRGARFLLVLPDGRDYNVPR